MIPARHKTPRRTSTLQQRDGLAFFLAHREPERIRGTVHVSLPVQEPMAVLWQPLAWVVLVAALKIIVPDQVFHFLKFNVGEEMIRVDETDLHRLRLRHVEGPLEIFPANPAKINV